MRQSHAFLNSGLVKKLFCLSLCLFAIGAADAQAASGGRSSSGRSSAHVGGYSNGRGTHVAPHYRTTPDRSRINNWSTRGNVNPYTGKPGTKSPQSVR